MATIRQTIATANSQSFTWLHTEGVDGHAIQEIYYPPDTWGRGRQDHEIAWEMKR